MENGFRAVAASLRAGALLFRGAGARRDFDAFLTSIPAGDSPASAGPPPSSPWTILFFLGTD